MTDCRNSQRSRLLGLFATAHASSRLLATARDCSRQTAAAGDCTTAGDCSRLLAPDRDCSCALATALDCSRLLATDRASNTRTRRVCAADVRDDSRLISMALDIARRSHLPAVAGDCSRLHATQVTARARSRARVSSGCSRLHSMLPQPAAAGDCSGHHLLYTCSCLKLIRIAIRPLHVATVRDCSRLLSTARDC